MKYRSVILVGTLLAFGAAMMGVQLASEKPTPDAWNPDTPVADVLNALGEPYPSNRPADLSDEMVRAGGEIFQTGTTIGPDGKRTRLQSRYFVCTDCHLVEKEDPDLRISNPDTRLDYVISQGMPFLQGTTMYGTVNKVTWYNDDYERKYGDFVKPARHSIEGAIHLCATVCSQGRALDPWEMKAMLAYFWSISLKLGDLNLTEADWKKLEKLQKTGKNDADAVAWLKTFYRSGSPATFLEAPENKDKGYDVARAGDPKIGEQLYEFSCLSCHGPQGPSKYLKLDNSAISLGLFRRHFDYDGYLSIYEIIRHGTHAETGHRPYMPNYTAERMSNQQVEDLRAYIEQGDPDAY